MQLIRRIRDEIRSSIRGSIRGGLRIKGDRNIIREYNHTVVRRQGTFRAGGNPLAANLFDVLRADFPGLAAGLAASTAHRVALSHCSETATRERAVIIRRIRSKDTVYQIITVCMVIMLRNDSISNAGSIRLALRAGDADSLTNIIIRSDLSVKTAGGQSFTPETRGRIAAAAFDSRANDLHGFTRPIHKDGAVRAVPDDFIRLTDVLCSFKASRRESGAERGGNVRAALISALNM